MPRLDLSRPWNAEADRQEPEGPEPEADDLLSEAEDLPEQLREPLSTTGVFDPTLLTREDEEGGPSSFRTLEYLKRLDKLLEETEEAEKIEENPGSEN
jgi:hypothetical protein